MTELMDTRVGCYAVVIDRERVLLAHWNEGDTRAWTLPGGALEPHEQPEDGVVRELKEETGYDVALDALLGVHVGHIAESERHLKGAGDLRLLRIVYAAHVVGGSLRHETDGTTDEARWVDLDSVPALERVDLVDVGLGMVAATSPAR